MRPSAWLLCGLILAATATTVSGQGTSSGVATLQPRHDSRQQREDSIEADRARKSGVMATQPSTATTSPPDVGSIQAALKAHGHDPGPVDGVMGARTQEALRAYQVSQGLKATGEIDPETIEKLGLARSSR